MARKLKSDKVLFITTILLVALSVVMVYSASAAVALDRYGSASRYLMTQAMWAALGIAMLYVVMRIDYRCYREPVFIWTCLALVSLGLVAVSIWTFAGLSHGRALTLFLTALGWWGSLALALLHLPFLRRVPLDPVARTIIGLGMLSFGIGYSFTVSWPLFENAAFPGLALVVAATLERPPSTAPRRWVVAILILAHLSMGLSLYRKFTYPHLWGAWIEPPLYSADGAFEHPALVGLRISEPSSDLYTWVARLAREHSAPDDRIYVFPNLPILYAIADRRPATFALAHWVDICPDYVGQEDAVRLRTSPPKIMILRADPVGLVGMEEWLYRGGEASSVRDVLAALEDLKPSYDKVSVFRNSASWPISIFVRREHPDGKPGSAP